MTTRRLSHDELMALLMSKVKPETAFRTVTECKQEAFDFYSTLTPEERLARAEFGADAFYGRKATDPYGNVFYASARIWIDHQGNLFKNKPKK